MSVEHITMANSDIAARAKGRVLRQFSKSPVFQHTLQQLTVEIQTLSNAIIAVILSRTLAGAVGAQLDAIGRIVGQTRIIPFYAVTNPDWFTVDESTLDMDTAFMWVTNGIDGIAHTMDDTEYRSMIEAKIYRNSCKQGNAIEIMTYAQKALGIPVSAVVNATGDIDIYIPAGTPTWKELWAKRCITDNRGDIIPVMPYPCNMIVKNVFYV